MQERMPTMVAGGRGAGASPVVELRVEVGQMRREREGVQVAKLRQPRGHVSPAFGATDQGALDLIEIPPGVMGQRVPRARAAACAGSRAADRVARGSS